MASPVGCSELFLPLRSPVVLENSTCSHGKYVPIKVSSTTIVAESLRCIITLYSKRFVEVKCCGRFLFVVCTRGYCSTVGSMFLGPTLAHSGGQEPLPSIISAATTLPLYHDIPVAHDITNGVVAMSLIRVASRVSFSVNSNFETSERVSWTPTGADPPRLFDEH